MRSRSVWLTACSVLALAACGGASKTSAPPRLPAPLARDLRAASDLVSSRLRAGDACGAHDAAAALQRRTIAHIGQVPRRLQEPLQSTVNDLVFRIPPCARPSQPPPPPSDVMHGNDNAKRGHGKAKHQKEKHGRKHGDGEGGD